MRHEIISTLGSSHPWADTLQWHNTIGSTNDLAKELARSGAPEGTVIAAGHQAKGRGRLGRSFHSPEGMGIYLSVILRPHCAAADLMHLTCAVAVAACDAVAETTGFRPGVKWINDLVAGGKKLGGILTELSLDSNGEVAFAVVGIGINCHQKNSDFPKDLEEIAISLETATAQPLKRHLLAASLIRHLESTVSDLLRKKSDIMARYRQDCVTLGKEIAIPQQNVRATALDVNDDGALLVRYGDGTVAKIATGEVSVRGLYGYC